MVSLQTPRKESYYGIRLCYQNRHTRRRRHIRKRNERNGRELLPVALVLRLSKLRTVLQFRREQAVWVDIDSERNHPPWAICENVNNFF